MRLLFFLLVGGTLLVLSGCASAASTQAPSAPPRKCEVRLVAWCIDEAAYEIIGRGVEDGVHDRAWTLRGFFRPESKLVVLEPNGCRTGRSDTLSLLSYESGVAWEGRIWERVKARLKTDGTCDLNVLIPPFDGDQMEWAFSTGLILVRSCPDEACRGPNLGQLKPEFEAQFRNSTMS